MRRLTTPIFTSLLWAGGIAVGLSSCAGAPNPGNQHIRTPGQGQYVYPRRLRPQPTNFNPRRDLCGAQLYQGLIGQPMGGIHLPVIAGDKRIIRPALEEIQQDDFLPSMNPGPPLLEVREMLAGAPLYTASIRTGVYPGQISPEQEDRLTITLDEGGYVQEVACG